MSLTLNPSAPYSADGEAGEQYECIGTSD